MPEPVEFTHEFPAAAYTMLALNGLSVILAVIGGAAFCVIIVGSLLFGKKLGDQKMAEPCIVAPVTDEEYNANGGSAFAIPGTYSAYRNILYQLRPVLLH